MCLILMSAVLIAAAMVHVSVAQRTVPGSYNVIFEPKTTGATAQENHIMAQELLQHSTNTLGIAMDDMSIFRIGTISVLSLQNVASSLTGKLLAAATAIGGKLSPNQVITLDLPRKPIIVAESAVVRPEALCTANCPACVTRTLIDPGLHNLNWLDLVSGDQTYCAPGPNPNGQLDLFILDTGVEITHPDLASVSIVRDDCRQVGQANWTPFEDLLGHGTHVTGIVASAKYGLTQNAFVHMIKVLSDIGSGSLTNLICGFSKVTMWLDANPTKKAVLSLSLGLGGIDISINAAIRNLAITYGSRVVVVVAAGNSAVPACTRSFGAVQELLVVGSVSPTLVQSTFSNFGTCVKIFANGERILSTYRGATTAFLSGTSMATPLVAARVVEYFLSNPTATGTGIISLVQSSSSDLFATGLLTGLSAGSPNKLVKYLCPGGCALANACTPNPCLNGGVCTTFPLNFVCDCAIGFTGTTCQTRKPAGVASINECDSSPCAAGCTCVDQVNSFSCICPGGCPTTTCSAGQRVANGQVCSRFCICSGGVMRRSQCLNGLVFDVDSGSCRAPEIAQTAPGCT